MRYTTIEIENLRDKIVIKPMLDQPENPLVSLTIEAENGMTILNENDLDELIDALIDMKYKVFPESDDHENPANTH